MKVKQDPETMAENWRQMRLETAREKGKTIKVHTSENGLHHCEYQPLSCGKWLATYVGEFSGRRDICSVDDSVVLWDMEYNRNWELMDDA